MASTMLKRLACVCALWLCAGCGGIGLQIIGTPKNVQGAQPVDFQIKLTNHSICPADSVVEVVPFLTDQQIISTADGEGVVLIQLICNGGIISGSQECTLSGDTITCNFPIPFGPGAPQPSTPQNFQFNPPGLPEPIPCTQTGGTVQCQIPLADRQAFTFAKSAQHTSLPSPGAPVTCVPDGPPPGSLVCPIPTLNAGAMTTFDITLSSPLTRGTFRTLAFAQQTNGVCQGGPTPTAPCSTSDTAPCGTGGTCRTSICMSGTTIGSGCALDADCTGGGTGSCQPCFTQGEETAITPLGCATTIQAVQAQAPVASRAGLLMVTAALFVVGAFLMRRQRRTN